MIPPPDQVKWHCPKNLPDNADFEPLWKAHLHMVCVIVYGIVECYFIMPPDLPKDSNMESTLIARAFDVAQDKLPPGTKLPHSFVFAADNTAKEMKNQFGAQNSAYLVAVDKFEGVENTFQKTGHSHFDVDQRFSEANTKLTAAGVLEDPYEFQEYLQRTMKPIRGRALHVEVVETIKDFRKFYAPLNVAMSGLAATHEALHTCHSWKFVQRQVLPLDIEEKLIVNMHPDWDALPSNPRDVILLCKESMSSTALAQAPLLVLPAVVADQLDTQQLENVPRQIIKEVPLKEFRKTASTVAQSPWDYFGASAWLTTICDASESNKPLPPLGLPFFQHYKMAPRPEQVSTFGTSEMRAPRNITVGPVTKAAMAKRVGKPGGGGGVPKAKAAGTTVKKRPAGCGSIQKRPASATPCPGKLAKKLCKRAGQFASQAEITRSVAERVGDKKFISLQTTTTTTTVGPCLFGAGQLAGTSAGYDIIYIYIYILYEMSYAMGC